MRAAADGTHAPGVQTVHETSMPSFKAPDEDRPPPPSVPKEGHRPDSGGRHALLVQDASGSPRPSCSPAADATSADSLPPSPPGFQAPGLSKIMSTKKAAAADAPTPWR